MSIVRTSCLAVVGAVLALSGCSSKESDATPSTSLTLIDPPAQGQGWQFETTVRDVPAGTESQVCFFWEVPSDTDVFVNRIELAQEPGSHHLNVFRVNTVKNLGGKNGDIVADGECWKSPNWSDWPIVANSQLSSEGNNIVDWKLPDGVAHKFKAHEMLMVQSHYVNATTQTTPGKGHAQINFYTQDASKVTAELGTVFTTNQNIKACPGDVDKSYSATCKFAKTTPVTIVGANGHFHSRGTRFTIAPWDSTDGAGAVFYDNRSWNEPLFELSENIPVPVNGGVQYTCEYSVPSTACANPNGPIPDGGKPGDECCYTFGGHVDAQEHCNAFIYYYPKQADINCF